MRNIMKIKGKGIGGRKEGGLCGLKDCADGDRKERGLKDFADRDRKERGLTRINGFRGRGEELSAD